LASILYDLGHEKAYGDRAPQALVRVAGNDATVEWILAGN